MYKEKTIAVMLDIAGTTDNINENNAQVFIKQLHYLLNKFSATKCFISISTHFDNCLKMKDILNVLSKYTDNNIIIGTSFFYGGSYDFYSDSTKYIDLGFNGNKILTFDEAYVNNSLCDNVWFGIFDDSISSTCYQFYQDSNIMLVGRPSQTTMGLFDDNFMVRSTETYGLDGVIEVINNYINDIDNLDCDEILLQQKNMMCHLSGYQLAVKMKEKNFKFLENYFSSDFVLEEDCLNFLNWLPSIFNKQNLTKEECSSVEEILNIISNYFSSKSEFDNVDKILVLQNKCKEYKFA